MVGLYIFIWLDVLLILNFKMLGYCTGGLFVWSKSNVFNLVSFPPLVNHLERPKALDHLFYTVQDFGAQPMLPPPAKMGTSVWTLNHKSKDMTMNLQAWVIKQFEGARYIELTKSR